ncbi:hypothetical protein Pelo_19835 [Pelomyxa schiedti]|nr:hypothetical protein Pelo_19835 [Pelomyxa schiedti]
MNIRHRVARFHTGLFLQKGWVREEAVPVSALQVVPRGTAQGCRCAFCARWVSTAFADNNPTLFHVPYVG